jgi:hypothetical protein
MSAMENIADNPVTSSHVHDSGGMSLITLRDGLESVMTSLTFRQHASVVIGSVSDSG